MVFNKWLLNYYISEDSVWTGKGLKDKRQRNDVLTLKIWKGYVLQLSNHELVVNSRMNSGRHKIKKHCEYIQKEAVVTNRQYGASYSKLCCTHTMLHSFPLWQNFHPGRSAKSPSIPLNVGFSQEFCP